MSWVKRSLVSQGRPVRGGMNERNSGVYGATLWSARSWRPLSLAGSSLPATARQSLPRSLSWQVALWRTMTLTVLGAKTDRGWNKSSPGVGLQVVHLGFTPKP